MINRYGMWVPDEQPVQKTADDIRSEVLLAYVQRASVNRKMTPNEWRNMMAERRAARAKKISSGRVSNNTASDQSRGYEGELQIKGFRTVGEQEVTDISILVRGMGPNLTVMGRVPDYLRGEEVIYHEVIANTSHSGENPFGNGHIANNYTLTPKHQTKLVRPYSPQKTRPQLV
jgi:hypothetical protein